MVDTTTAIRRHHHITLCVGTAQEDYDFHTKVLGLKSVKKTALYDGDVPIYHLYYGNDQGAESTLVTSFPMRQSGRVGRRGTNQTRALMLSIPETSIGYWRSRLNDHDFTVEESEVFGEKRLDFTHPCGIEYALVGVTSDQRPAHSSGPVPQEFGIHGTHGITVSVRELDLSAEFMTSGWSGHLTQEEGASARFEVGDGGSGCIVDFVAEPQLDQAGWMYGEGIVHHTAFQVADYDTQTNVKSHLEGLGFTDVSERKDRGYFESIYVRIPSGALFEATVSKPEGFLIDEPYESLGKTFQVPPVFADQREFLMSYLEPLEY
ncbi:MAG TPA: hydroxyquinol 1,2-dioxygenase [Acidimicrobiales bacterium]|jgi:glyoxalase family protein|nr:hydroxyquinol 1,2-dioxygenase [Acidimicrobiales bacterium]